MTPPPAFWPLAGRGGRNAGSGGKEGLFAGDRMVELTEQARAMVNAGRGRELMLIPGWWYVISAESFLDRIETVPDIIAAAPKIKLSTKVESSRPKAPEASR